MNKSQYDAKFWTVIIVLFALMIFVRVAWIARPSTVRKPDERYYNRKIETSQYKTKTYDYESPSSGTAKSTGGIWYRTGSGHSGYDSYDDGYNAVYEDDDYDWDRYVNDPDYADGVDEAIDDWDYDGGW